MPGDLRQVISFVQALLEDAERLDRMSPLEHLYWARSMPKCADPQAPEHLRAALNSVLSLTRQEMNARREAARQHWLERKRVLDPMWEYQFRLLPEHVRSILGPKKNLLLLAELLTAAGSPDCAVAPRCRRPTPLRFRMPPSAA